MARPPVFPAEEKVRIVLSILAGEMTVAEAARRAKVSEQSVGNWKRQFLESGRAGLAAGKSGPSSREQQREAEVADLTQALGEAAAGIRVWK
jgi:transposase